MSLRLFEMPDLEGADRRMGDGGRNLIVRMAAVRNGRGGGPSLGFGNDHINPVSLRSY
jgi:hypothetical protein